MIPTLAIIFRRHQLWTLQKNWNKNWSQKILTKELLRRKNKEKKFWRCQHNFLNTVRCRCFDFYRFYAFLTTHTTRSKMPKIIPAFKTANYSVLKDTFLPRIASSLRKDFFRSEKSGLKVASKITNLSRKWDFNEALSWAVSFYGEK